MSRVQTKQTLKLRLLALVLTLALIWYSLNPVPRPSVCHKRDNELPDEKKRNAELYRMPETLSVMFKPAGEAAESMPSLDEDEDDLEWPEFIDG
jgi:hypothetical protein